MKKIWNNPAQSSSPLLGVMSAVISLLILAMIGYLSGQGMTDPLPSGQVFIRTFGVVLVFIVAWIFGRRILKFSESGFAPWWDVGKKRDSPDWNEVRRMTLGKLRYDPLQYEPTQQSPIIVTGQMIVAFLLLGCFAIVVLSIIAENRILPFLLTDYADDRNPSNAGANVILNLSANLTAFLALIAAAVSIIFTHRQLQAKVKADSRQAWIDKLRALTARFVALADVVNTHPIRGWDPLSRQDRHKYYIELTDCRLEMELMLNPSEKDHRLLMYLTMKLSFFQFDPSDFESIDDVNNILKAIRRSNKYREVQWHPLLKPIPEKGAVDRDAEFSKLIGYTMRLAHIVLKREWERVKATR